QADELPPETETHFTETPEIEETIGLIDAIHEDIAAIQDDPVVFDGVLNETTEDNIDYDLPLAEPTHEEIESITADNLDIIEEVLSEDTESITEDNLAVTEEVPNEALDSSDENNEEIADEVLSEATTDTYLTAESEFTGETEAEPELIVTEQTEPELPQGEDLFAVIQNSLAKTSEILDNPPEEPLTNRPAAELALNTETEAAALPLSKDFSQKIMEQVSPEDLAKLQAALAKTDVNAKDSFGITPLGLAVSYGQLHTVAVLLTNGANIKATNNYGATAIHATTKLAAGPNKEDILTLLLEHGADINAKDNYGQTALHIEARFGQLPALEYLLKHGAAINQLDNKGAAALNYAVLRGDTSLVYSLLMAGAKSNIIDGYGRPLEDWVSPTDKIMLKLIRNFKLVQSIAKGSALEDIDDLLHKGADVNSFSFEGTPALHLAITHQDSSILVKLLLESGAQINLTDNLGHTALHLASLHNKIELIDLLLSYGIKINGRNNNGFTALELAEQNNFSELAALLQQRGAHGQLSKGTLANNEVKKETTKNKDGYEESPLHRLIKKQAAAQPKND
ncbi:MAG: ankyrin repeat domain-containing protein, partial [Spirochaetaceae bacterium]|nr:ankyrin repeat domain-containing protein [Spirochaetaceae bacterium]